MTIRNKPAQKEGYHEYDSKLYLEKVEKIKDPIFQRYEKEEMDYIKVNIRDAKEKTFVDLGAGYGRIEPELSRLGKEVIAIELGHDMFATLKENMVNFGNVKVINGDIKELSSLVGPINKPVFLIMQNTLGLWVNDLDAILREVHKVAKENKGEIVISSFNGESLKDWGVSFYGKISALVGEPDFDTINHQTGIFASKTGYFVKWRTQKEMEDIGKDLEGTVIAHLCNHNFQILHISYE